MELTNKSILIISQEDWGEMFISKHHYAVELGKRGNKVFFVNYPDQERKLKRGAIQLSETAYQNVSVIKHRLFFPYFFKFRFPYIYHFLIRIHIKRILRRCGAQAELIWSFDLSNSLPLNCFPASLFKIFMPVDEPFHDYSFKAATDAHIMFSVTNEILEKYVDFLMPKYFINHGVAEYFINQNPVFATKKPIRVGYSGGLLRQEIDWVTYFKIIEENPEIMFDFWGEYDYDNSFINTAVYRNEAIIANINKLKSYPNVQLHGVLPPKQLLEALKKADILFICYDIQKDQSHGTNYHKILEYLGTGKVVISNNVSTYWKNYPGIIEMTESRDNNFELPQLFKTVVANLEEFNSPVQQQKRIAFGKQFIYAKQLEKIEGYISQLTESN